jgi:hypothetical protein
MTQGERTDLHDATPILSMSSSAGEGTRLSAVRAPRRLFKSEGFLPVETRNAAVTPACPFGQARLNASVPRSCDYVFKLL